MSDKEIKEVKEVKEVKEDSLPLEKSSGVKCPQKEIVSLYHSILPELSPVKQWDGDRQAKLRARWREDKKRQSLEYWKKLFHYISESDFLMGRVNGFKTNLAWIVTRGNFIKIIEGNYENRG